MIFMVIVLGGSSEEGSRKVKDRKTVLKNVASVPIISLFLHLFFHIKTSQLPMILVKVPAEDNCSRSTSIASKDEAN